MAELTFTCVDVSAERYAAAPSLLFRVRITGDQGQRVRAVALRCQIRVEPQRRGYTDEESGRLVELFGERGRWADTLKPFPFAHTSTVVPSFTGETEVDLPVACSYDMEVATGRYFHALDEGEVPFLLLFSGTVFGDGGAGLWVEQVPWSAECRYRMPARVWRELMDRYFPGSGWLMLRRETLDELAGFRAARGSLTWDDTVRDLLVAASSGVAAAEPAEPAAPVEPAGLTEERQ